MEPNIHIISERPFKYHTEIIKNIGSIYIQFYFDDDYLFSFNPKRNNLYFKNIGDLYLINKILNKNIGDLYLINKILKTKDIESYIHCGLYCANLDNNNNIEKLKELINNHTLSDEEKIAFKDFITEPEFKLKFVD